MTTLGPVRCFNTTTTIYTKYIHTHTFVYLIVTWGKNYKIIISVAFGPCNLLSLAPSAVTHFHHSSTHPFTYRLHHLFALRFELTTSSCYRWAIWTGKCEFIDIKIKLKRNRLINNSLNDTWCWWSADELKFIATFLLEFQTLNTLSYIHCAYVFYMYMYMYICINVRYFWP